MRSIHDYAAVQAMRPSGPCDLFMIMPAQPIRPFVPCGLRGHAVYMAMRSMWPSGLRDHAVRGRRLLTINIACLPCLVVRAILLQTDLIGGKDIAFAFNCFNLDPVNQTPHYLDKYPESE